MNPDPQVPQNQPEVEPQPLTPPLPEETTPQPLTPAEPVQPAEQPQPVQPEAPLAQPEVTQPNPFFAAQSPQPQTFGPAPVAPTPDVQPQPAQPIPGAPVPTGKKPRNKKLLIGIIAGAAVLVLAVVAVVLYMTFFMVKKEDYQAVETQITAMSDKIKNASVEDTSASTIEVNEKRLAELKAEHAKLADLKAVRYDSEVNEKFKAYDDKVQQYIAFMEDFLPSMTTFTDANKEAQAKIRPVSVAGLNEAAAIYKKAADDVAEPGIKAFLEQSASSYATAAEAYGEYQAATAAAQRTAAQTKFQTALTSLSAAAKTMGDDLKKKVDEISPEQTYKEFNDLVKEKIKD